MDTFLEQINDIFGGRRQNGHTEALINGAISSPNSTIVVPNMNMVENIKRRISIINGGFKVKVITIHQLRTLRGGTPGPILIDNSCFHIMTKEVIETTETMIHKIVEEFGNVMKIYQKRIDELKLQVATLIVTSRGYEIKRNEDK